FLDYWIFGVKDQYEFIEKLGGSKWIAESRRLTKAEEYDNEDSGVDFNYEEFQGDWPEDITKMKFY
ncbi:MAG TPA: hypothetical protein PLV62_04035, partial [Spirochaetota bacterium]|nr:hypothetical protein [Spirochaetota bacterium]